MRLTSYLFLIFAGSLLAACSPGGRFGEPLSLPAVPDQKKAGAGDVAQGKINGQAWDFRGGRAFFKKYQTNYLVVELWSEDLPNPCKEKKGSILQIRLTAPKELATWNISPEDTFNSVFSIFFADLDFKPQAHDNMRADRGEITLTSIDKRFVGGYIAGSFQNPKVGETRVAGDFVVPFCQYGASSGDNF